MKTTVMAAFAAIALSSAAMADDFDANRLTTKVTVDNLEFSVSTDVSNSLDGFGDTWAIGAGLTVLEYDLGSGVSDLFVFGRYEDATVNTQLGAEYTWTVVKNDTTVALAGEALYDFNRDAVLVTPSVNVEYAVSRSVDVFGEVGYTWDASNDFARDGGYLEVGADLALSEAVNLRPSVVQGFDDGAEDAQFNLELGLKF